MRILDCRQLVTGGLNLECDCFSWFQHFQVSLFLRFVLHADPIVLFKTFQQLLKGPRYLSGKKDVMPAHNSHKYKNLMQTYSQNIYCFDINRALTFKETQKTSFLHNIKQLTESCLLFNFFPG